MSKTAIALWAVIVLILPTSAIAEGARVKATDNLGHSALTCAVQSEQMECAAVLLKNGADLNATDPYGWTALMNAVYLGDTDLVQILLEGASRLITATISAVRRCSSPSIPANRKLRGWSNLRGRLNNPPLPGNKGVAPCCEMPHCPPIIEAFSIRRS